MRRQGTWLKELDPRAKQLWTQPQPTTDYSVGPGQMLHSAMTELKPCWEVLVKSLQHA